MLRLSQEPAFVIHLRAYQETSLIVEFFTKNHGRLAMVAKGAKRPRSKNRGLLQPFQFLMISGSGKGELLTFKEAEPLGRLMFLQGQALMSGFYLNELLMRLITRFDPHPDIYDYYQKTIEDLVEGSSIPRGLRLFEKTLLKSMGYELQLLKEADTERTIDPERLYVFDPSLGPKAVIGDMTTKSKNNMSAAIKASIFKGSSLIALAKEELTDPIALLDARRLMRLSLKLYLGEKPLESRRLFEH